MSRKIETIQTQNKISDLVEDIKFDEETVQPGKPAQQVPAFAEAQANHEAHAKANENSLEKDRRESKAKMDHLGQMLLHSVPFTLQDPEIIKEAGPYISDFFLALDTAVKNKSKAEEGKLELPEYLPKFNQENRIVQWPVTLPIPVEELTERVGNTMFLEFYESFKEKVMPVFTKTFIKHFNDKFEPVDESIVGSVFMSSTGFPQSVTGFNKETNTVEMVDVSFNEIDQRWVIITNSNFNVQGHVFKEEYEFKERPSIPPS